MPDKAVISKASIGRKTQSLGLRRGRERPRSGRLWRAPDPLACYRRSEIAPAPSIPVLNRANPREEGVKSCRHTSRSRLSRFESV